MLEKIKVPTNLEMEACKRILSNTHGKNFVNAVAYLSSQVAEIFLNAQIENKTKLRLSELRTALGQGRGCGRGFWQSDRRERGCGRGGGGCGVYPDRPYNTWEVVDIQYISRDFRSANWDALQRDG